MSAGKEERDKEKSAQKLKRTDLLNVDIRKTKEITREKKKDYKVTTDNKPQKSNDTKNQKGELSPQGSETFLTKYLKTTSDINQLQNFVNRLEKLIAAITNLEGVKMLYKVSNEMTEKVKNNIQELEFLMLEVKATLNNILGLKKQKGALSKEKEAVTATLGNLKLQEILEMETIITIYDKDLLRKWHSVKKTSSIQSIENFITYLKGRKQAVDFVYELATDRIITLRDKLGKTNKRQNKSVMKALPPPASGSDQDSIFSAD